MLLRRLLKRFCVRNKSMRLFVRKPIHLMVKLVADVLVVLEVLFGLEVAEHSEKDLSREHGVASGLMHVAFPDNTEELADSL